MQTSAVAVAVAVVRVVESVVIVVVVDAASVCPGASGFASSVR